MAKGPAWPPALQADLFPQTVARVFGGGQRLKQARFLQLHEFDHDFQ